MKDFLKSLIVVVFTFLLSSCTHEKTAGTTVPSVKVEVSASSSPVALSEISDFSIIPLPTSDSLLVDEIRNIHSDSEYVYVSDGSSIYKFAYDGSLAGQVSKRGSGPDEYLGIDDFQINKDGNVLILSRNLKSLLLYSWENKLLKKMDIGLWAMNICLLGNKVLLFTGNEETPSKNQLHQFDMSTGQIERSFKPINETKAGYLHIMGKNIFRMLSDEVCVFSEMFNDSIYKITADSYGVERIFDWDGHNVPASFYEKNYANVMEFFRDFHQVGTYAYGINVYLENPSSYWVSYYYQQNCFLSIVPKNGDRVLISDKLILDTSFGEYPIELIEAAMFVQDSGDIIIPLDVMSVKEHLSSSSKDLVGRDWQEVPEDSNPYLLVISPKK